jgi:hypothetical protein
MVSITIDRIPFFLALVVLLPRSMNHVPRSITWFQLAGLIYVAMIHLPTLSHTTLEKQHSWNKCDTVSRFVLQRGQK